MYNIYIILCTYTRFRSVYIQYLLVCLRLGFISVWKIDTPVTILGAYFIQHTFFYIILEFPPAKIISYKLCQFSMHIIA